MPYPFTPAQLLWLEELESGKYKQGARYLLRDNEYCCLGIACEIYNKSHPADPSAIKIRTDDDNKQITSFDNTDSVLPDRVVEWLKIRFDNGALSLVEPEKHGSLATMNDEGVSFADIAAYIRANPEKIFIT